MEEQIGQNIGVVVKIGNNVHRTLPPNNEFIHKFLRYLHTDVSGIAPQLMGVDKQGREMLKFIPGDVPPSESKRMPETWTIQSIQAVFELIRMFHDSAAKSDLIGDKETVIHGDLTPRNTVYRDGVPIAFIDWDLSRPGDRSEDLGTAFWRFLALGSPGHNNVVEQSELLIRCCDAYGVEDRRPILGWIDLAQQSAIEVAESRSDRKTNPYTRLVHRDLWHSAQRDNKWLKQNTNEIAKIITS